jgi:hypothetical protein
MSRPCQRRVQNGLRHRAQDRKIATFEQQPSSVLPNIRYVPFCHGRASWVSAPITRVSQQLDAASEVTSALHQIARLSVSPGSRGGAAVVGVISLHDIISADRSLGRTSSAQELCHWLAPRSTSTFNGRHRWFRDTGSRPARRVSAPRPQEGCCQRARARKGQGHKAAPAHRRRRTA